MNRVDHIKQWHIIGSFSGVQSRGFENKYCKQNKALLQMLPSKSEQPVSSLQLERVTGNFAVVIVSLLFVRAHHGDLKTEEEDSHRYCDYTV